ncbi:hypothetical protein K2173_008564 [Erythroxylum novogranatense]|uniref:C3H1-type domain-containing protein n=1 Tax=Erythroxylum novogranatense TaxID=1862640 RepID=A0AAV8SLB8_9ROSI|nr:hypothetical protein K2173_008564 [Erythroxylum novogranatense]
MFKGVNPYGYNSRSDFVDHPFTSRKTSNGFVQQEDIDEMIYGSDEFRMYGYKIKRCPRMYTHDWTECPFAHRGEKATRRDLLKVPYLPIACPMFRSGACTKGDLCQYSHGVFEYWLHPARYRTRACNAGPFCQRKVCFFAHTPAQIRPGKKIECPFVYRPRNLITSANGYRSSSLSSNSLYGPPSMTLRMDGGSYNEGVSEFLSSMTDMNLTKRYQEQARSRRSSELDELYYPDFPEIDWVSDLVH